MKGFHQILHPAVREFYSSNCNFEIFYDDCVDEDKESVVCVYFSSNGLYYPNTLKNFQNFINRNHFDWKSNKLPNVRKHIFIRDIYKQWYVKGINNEINSIDKLIGFLSDEIKGYKLITVGSSSGGYMAMLSGRILKAEKIYCFNGQFDINDQIKKQSNRKLNPLLSEFEFDTKRNKYFNLIPHLEIGNSPIYYFNSAYSKWDSEQAFLMKNINNIYPFYIKSELHGIPFYKHNLKEILKLPDEKLEEISSEKLISQFWFSVKIEGVYKSLAYWKINSLDYNFNKLKKWLKI